MKPTFAILGIIAAIGLLVSIATPNAFAISQSSIQSSELSSSLSQTGINIGHPQINVQSSSQSTVQTDCVFVTIFCS